MPLLNPSQIHAVLKETKLSPNEEGERGLKGLLEDNNLSPAEVLDSLASIMRGGENESVRLRATESALKLNGLLNNNEGVVIPHVTIVINNGDFELNPILIPR